MSMSDEIDVAKTLAELGATEMPMDSVCKAKVGRSVINAKRSESSKVNKSPNKRRKKVYPREQTYPVQPNTIQIVKMPRTHVDHSYRDFSNVPSKPGWAAPKEDKPFPQKLHELLSLDNDYTRQRIRWCSHGRAFNVVVDPEALEDSGLLRTHFGYNRYAKFLRDLSSHGFKRLTEGRDCGCFYSEFLLRGLPHLVQYSPEPIVKRKLLPDPDNEPDFYEINKLFPLPDEKNSDVLEEAKEALAARGVIISDSVLAANTVLNGTNTPTGLSMAQSLPIGFTGTAQILQPSQRLIMSRLGGAADPFFSSSPLAGLAQAWLPTQPIQAPLSRASLLASTTEQLTRQVMPSRLQQSWLQALHQQYEQTRASQPSQRTSKRR